MALVVVVLLDGCQLYALTLIIVSAVLLSDDTFKVQEDAAESGKAKYSDFKCIVWHKSFYELLASICELSKLGYHVECADGEIRHIFPAILILSADYEEQYG